MHKVTISDFPLYLVFRGSTILDIMIQSELCKAWHGTALVLFVTSLQFFIPFTRNITTTTMGNCMNFFTQRTTLHCVLYLLHSCHIKEEKCCILPHTSTCKTVQAAPNVMFCFCSTKIVNRSVVGASAKLLLIASVYWLHRLLIIILNER